MTTALSQSPTVSAPERTDYTKVFAALVFVGLLLLAAKSWGFLGGYQPTTNLQVEIASVSRSYLITPCCSVGNTEIPIGFAQFTMEVDVSNTGSSNVALQDITFQLTIDSIVFPVSPYQIDTTLASGYYSQIPINFITHDASIIAYVSQHGSYELTLSMTAWETSETYSGWSTTSYSNTYSFPPCNGIVCY